MASLDLREYRSSILSLKWESISSILKGKCILACRILLATRCISIRAYSSMCIHNFLFLFLFSSSHHNGPPWMMPVIASNRSCLHLLSTNTPKRENLGSSQLFPTTLPSHLSHIFSGFVGLLGPSIVHSSHYHLLFWYLESNTYIEQNSSAAKAPIHRWNLPKSHCVSTCSSE